MSAYEVTDRLVEAIESRRYDAIICNFANSDMVGHTGNLAAATRAIEVLDECIGRAVTAMREIGGEVLITADHGNAETMLDTATGQAHTAHTLNLVPLLYVGRTAQVADGGALRDVAPTLLAMMGLEQPGEMTGQAPRHAHVSRRGAAILLLALAAAPAASPAAAPAGAKEEKELRELRGRIAALQKRLADAEESQSEAVDALKESERAISDANRELRDLAAQARELNARLTEVRAESGSGQRALANQQALLARVLYHNYVGGRSEPLKLLLNREDPNQIARQLHYLIYVSRARAAVISGLRGNLEHLKDLANETADKARELAAITAEQQQQRQRLERENAARGATLTRISREITLQRREIGALKRNEDRLARLVESLSRLVAREPRPAPRVA